MIQQTPQSTEHNLVKAWLWLHVLALLAITLQKSTPVAVLGQYSKRSFAILVFFAITLPVMWVVTRWLVRHMDRIGLPQRAYGLLFAACAASLLGEWALHVGPTRSYVIVRLYISLVIFSVGLWSLRHLALPNWGKTIARLIGIASIAVLFILSLHFPGLRWTDEGYAANAAWESAHTGKTTVSMYQPSKLETLSSMYRALGVWFEPFGVSLQAARAFTYTMALVALAITFAAALTIAHETAVWAAGIVTLFSFVPINYLYQNIEVTVLLAVGYALFIAAERSGKTWLHLLVGLAVGFSVDGHPIAYGFGVAFGVAYMLEWALVIIRERRRVLYWPLLYLAIGGVVGSALFIGLYQVVGSSLYSDYASESPFFLQSPSSAFRLLRDQIDSALIYIPLLVGLGLFGAVTVSRQDNRLVRLLLISLVVPLVVLAVLYDHNRQYYLLHLLVPLMLLAALGLHKLRASYPPERQATIMLGIVVMVTAASVGGLLDVYAHRSAQDYGPALRVAQAVRALIPRDAKLVGIDPFYFELSDYDHFMDITAPVHNNGFTPEELASGQAWETVTPDAVVVVYSYPLVSEVNALVAYVKSQPDLQRVRCWTVERLGQVDLFVRAGMFDITANDACQPLPAS